ncbi:hypothetical protein [Salipiger abyssi]|uniref:hypothetical protein n=1 Tax=Salipiger abyssi TaxID=1250539 RepID=UPI004057D223
MTPLDLHSEPFAKTGNMAAEGARRLLGRPPLGQLQTVVREALQNSIDAGRKGQSVEILIRYRTLSDDELECLRGKVFAALPPGVAESADSPGPGTVIESNRLAVLEIADFGTSGLGGPTRADIVIEGETPDFVNFLRNVGAARDTHLGGGTYGYGKTSLYALSTCSTILVDSNATSAGQQVRRLMGCHLGSAFEAPQDGLTRRFTGRHWWGRYDDEAGVDPLEGPEAIAVSAALGLPARGETDGGTTIAIIAPAVDADDNLGKELVENVLWTFWPRMCASTPPDRRLNIRIEVEGQEIAIPAPEYFPPLDLFAASLAKARVGEGEDTTNIFWGNARKRLGCLAITRGFRAPRHPMRRAGDSLFPAQASSIALMRPVELVVRYMEGTPFPDEHFEWGGVFICSDEEEIERAFAASEPPAHDDWSPGTMAKGSNAKSYVNVALARIQEAARNYVQPSLPNAAEAEQGPSVVATASRLGALLNRTSGTGPGKTKTSKGSVGGRKKVALSAPRFAGLTSESGKRFAFFEAELRNDGSNPDLVLQATPHLVIDGSSASLEDLPQELAPTLESMTLAEEVIEPADFRIGARQGSIRFKVRIHGDAAVGIRAALIEDLVA